MRGIDQLALRAGVTDPLNQLKPHLPQLEADTLFHGLLYDGKDVATNSSGQITANKRQALLKQVIAAAESVAAGPGQAEHAKNTAPRNQDNRMLVRFEGYDGPDKPLRVRQVPVIANGGTRWRCYHQRR